MSVVLTLKHFHTDLYKLVFSGCLLHFLQIEENQFKEQLASSIYTVYIIDIVKWLFAVLKSHHVSQFMSNDGGNPLFVWVGRELFIVEQCCLSVRDQTPVLHGSSIKVW